MSEYLSFFSLCYLILAVFSLPFSYYCCRLSTWYLCESCQKCLKPIFTCLVMLLALCWVEKNYHHSLYQFVRFVLCHLYLRLLFLILDCFSPHHLEKQGRLMLFILLEWVRQNLQLSFLRKFHHL